MKAFWAAWQFLTVLPAPSLEFKDKHIQNAKYFFPWVGLVLGTFLAIVDGPLLKYFPVSVGSVLEIILALGLSGALHADGLADTADGFFSSRPRERILEIMRDSRSGPMGVLALLSVFGLKFTCLAELSGRGRTMALILAPVLGRCNLLLGMDVLGYARAEGGMVDLFRPKGPPQRWKGFLMVGAYLAATIFLGIFGRKVETLSILLIVSGSVAVCLSFSYYCWKKIGGLTGDTLGALCELTELWVLLGGTFIQKVAMR